ncbi:hypothetical protein, partial [Enterococcus cecorum]|uniref:hypothetical protein n=1 Tax=Enterococcus cecorum TaxID=44008 RepID=UPI003BF45E97
SFGVASYGERKCVRLACIRHAASVRPEPGSNSHKKVLISQKMTLSSKLILLAIACMYFSLTQKLKTLHIGCLHLFVQFSKVYFVV